MSPNVSADTSLSAIWLSELIHQQAIDAALRVAPPARHVDGRRPQAAKDVVQNFPTPDIFPAFDAKFEATLTDRQARGEALLASYTDTSDAAGQKYFDAHQSPFACPSGKNVAHILVATQAEAQAILDQLKGGASFAQARAAKSTDTGSGAKGGRSVASPRAVRARVRERGPVAPFGTPVGPVHSQFGYHVILVTHADVELRRRRGGGTAGARAAGPDRVPQTRSTACSKSFKVHLDPRFGTWGRSPRPGPDTSTK